MKGFLDKLTGGEGDNKKKDGRNNNNNNNPFANMGIGKKQTFGGTGQSLGGSKPGKVYNISLENPGPLGMKIEKRPNSKTAIAALIVPNGQAEKAGLQRGDILCFAGSNGQDEIMFDDFLQMAKSDQRPLVFDIRRIVTVSSKKNEKASSSSTSSSTATNNNKHQSADAHARKQAVIAAAEAREKKHKQLTKPKPKTTKSSATTDTLISTVDKRRLEEEREARAREAVTADPMSQEAIRAIEIAKKDERSHAAQLGYNPYETSKVNAGQARTATVAMTHGTITNGNSDGSAGAGESQLPAVAPPTPPTTAAASEQQQQATSNSTNTNNIPVSIEFEDAMTTFLSTNRNEDDIKSSLKIISKLIVNATTKGQDGGSDEETAAKFRRVRLSNPKIKASITDMNGALDIMLSVGFQFVEEDGETYLVYPHSTKGPEWLPTAIEILNNAQNQSSV